MRTQIPGSQILDGTLETEDIFDEAVTDDKLSPTGVAAGTFTKITLNSKGRATAAENPTTLAGYGITDAAPSAPSFVTINAEASLPNERRLVGTANQVIITDNGANTTVTLSVGTELAGLSTLASTGLVTRTAAGTYAARSVVSGGTIAITNPAGTAGNVSLDLTNLGAPGTFHSVTVDTYGRVTAGTNPTTLAGYGITDAQPLDADLTAIAAFAGTGIAVRTGTDTWAQRTITPPGVGGITVTNPGGVAGNIAIGLANDLASLETLGSTGIAVRVGTDSWAQRSITAGSTKISITNGDAVVANPAIDVVEANLTLNSIGGTLGIAKGGTNLTALGTANQVLGVNAGATALEYKTLTQPAAGLTVSHSAGAVTYALANDLAALEGLASTGIAVRTGTDTWAQRSIVAGTGVVVTNGSGVAGNITIAADPALNEVDAVRVATTGNITISAPGATIDGVTMVAGDRVLVRAQTSLPENGIYIWNGAAAAMTRSIDCSSDWNGQVVGRNLYVYEGTLYGAFNFRFVAAFNGTFGTTDMNVFSGWWQAGRFAQGDSVTGARAATGGFGQRAYTLIDTNAYGRIWRFVSSGSGNSAGFEFAVGNNDDLANAANYWWDIAAHSADQEGFRISRRTGGTIDPKWFIDTAGRMTVGTTVFSAGSSGPAFASTNDVAMYINALTGVRLPLGTTAQRPAAPVAGTIRGNSSTTGLEYYNGTAWIPSGKVLQVVSGSPATASSNSQIPYDNTTPLSTEGFQLWSQAFTPILATSTIVIITNSFYTVNSGADVYVSAATFNGTTCFHAAMIGFTTNSGNGSSYTVVATQSAGSTATRTYSFRAGPNSNVTTYYGQGTTGQAFGGVQTESYVIMEIAP